MSEYVEPPPEEDGEPRDGPLRDDPADEAPADGSPPPGSPLQSSAAADDRLPSGVEADRLSGLLDEIADLEVQVARLQGLQLRATAEFAAGCRGSTWAGGGWSSLSRQLAAVEVAAARRVTISVAERYLSDAVRLVDDLPKVLSVLTRGDTTLQAARAVAAEVVNLLPQTLPLADEILADDIVDVLPSQARRLARTRVCELDPDAATDAALSARADRMVVLTDSAAVSMGNLTAVLPAEQAAACHSALSTHAQGLRHRGDVRTVSQIMADTLVERVTGQATATAVPVTVGLVMTDTTLLGADDQPAQLPGLGPLPAPVARWLTAHDTTWIRRLYTDPIDASVAVVDTRRRRFDGALRELCLARDQTCRLPGCTAKIRHLDHTLDYQHAGPTTASNGRGYSERCHRLKHHPHVSVSTAGLASDIIGYQAYTRWTMPTGRTLASLPPPALGPGTTNRAQTRHRHELQHRLSNTQADWIWPPSAGSATEQRTRHLLDLVS